MPSMYVSHIQRIGSQQAESLVAISYYWASVIHAQWNVHLDVQLSNGDELDYRSTYFNAGYLPQETERIYNSSTNYTT